MGAQSPSASHFLHGRVKLASKSLSWQLKISGLKINVNKRKALTYIVCDRLDYLDAEAPMIKKCGDISLGFKNPNRKLQKRKK